MNWLTDILAQHREYESPKNFWYWSALAALSAVVKDNVWVERAGLYKSYANIYVILYADSGLKKGPPISMARQLVTLVNNTTIIYGRSSIQAILKKMGTTVSVPGGDIKSGSKVFICASELAASLVDDPAALGILTDFYDRIFHFGEYESLLKMETFTIKDATVSLLGGINEAHANVLFTKRDIQGGFIGRCFIIHETNRQAVNALIDRPEIIPDYKKAAEYLKTVAKLRGPFKELSGTPVGEMYKSWYHANVAEIEKSGMKDQTGTLNRYGESVMKVAMLLSLAEKPELEITEAAMELAIEHCKSLIGNVRKTTLSAGKQAFTEEKALLITELVNREPHIISQKMVNQKFWMRASLKDWNEVALQLEAAGIMQIETQGNQVMYVMTEHQAAQWKAHFGGK